MEAGEEEVNFPCSLASPAGPSCGRLMNSPALVGRGDWPWPHPGGGSGWGGRRPQAGGEGGTGPMPADLGTYQGVRGHATILGTSPAPASPQFLQGLQIPQGIGARSTAGLDVATSPPALPSSPSQRKIPLGRTRPPARLGWAVWHDAQCRGGGQARRADCVAPPAEARRRLAPDRSGQSPGARLQPPAPTTPRLELGTQGHVGFVGPRGTRGTPRPRQHLHHPPW